MKTYTNDLPDIFVYVDGFEANMNVCGKGFVIGPDIEDKPVPGMGLMVEQVKLILRVLTSATIFGALTLIFPEMKIQEEEPGI